MRRADYAVSTDPLLKSMSECGDTGRIIEYDRRCLLALADVLGHGAEARKAAIIIEEYLEQNYEKDLLQILSDLHEKLAGTRGAVMALCLVDMETGQMQHAAIGNITVRVLGYRPVRLIARDGILGYGTIAPVIQGYTLKTGDTLLLHSDGIREHFDELECLEFIKNEAEIVAKEILNRFGRKSDDASCIAFRYLDA